MVENYFVFFYNLEVLSLERRQTAAPLPLFDKFSGSLSSREAEIRANYDGTMGNIGIRMVLITLTGDPLRAETVDLLTGKTQSYQPLARGHWCSTSPTRDIEKGTRDYEKMETVLSVVKGRWREWRGQASAEEMRKREWQTERVYVPVAPEAVEIPAPAEKPKVKRKTRRKKETETAAQIQEPPLEDASVEVVTPADDRPIAEMYQNGITKKRVQEIIDKFHLLDPEDPTF